MHYLVVSNSPSLSLSGGLARAPLLAPRAARSRPPLLRGGRASFLDYKASVLRLLPSWAAVLAAVESFASARVLGDKDVEAALVALRKMGTGPTAWPPGW